MSCKNSSRTKKQNQKLDSIDVLKSLKTKIGKVNAPDKSDLTREAPSALAEFGKIDAPDKSDLTYEAPSALAKISIANLIDIAQPLHPEIFSKDVSDALKVSYEGKKINARFAVGGIFTGSAADYANRSRDLTPAMVQTMTVEDIADAIGAEMIIGRGDCPHWR